MQSLIISTSRTCKLIGREWALGTILNLHRKIHIPSQRTQNNSIFLHSKITKTKSANFSSFSTNVLGEAIEQERLGSEEEIIEVEKKFFSQLPGIDLPLRRTFLYVPASDEGKIRKSATFDVDVVCYDLEGNSKKSM